MFGLSKDGTKYDEDYQAVMKMSNLEAIRDLEVICQNLKLLKAQTEGRITSLAKEKVEDNLKREKSLTNVLTKNLHEAIMKLAEINEKFVRPPENTIIRPEQINATNTLGQINLGSEIPCEKAPESPQLQEQNKELEPNPTPDLPEQNKDLTSDLPEQNKEPNPTPDLPEQNKESNPTADLPEQNKEPNPTAVLQKQIKQANPTPDLQKQNKEPNLTADLQKQMKQPNPTADLQKRIKQPNPTADLQRQMKQPNPTPDLPEQNKEPNPTLALQVSSPTPKPPANNKSKTYLDLKQKINPDLSKMFKRTMLLNRKIVPEKSVLTVKPPNSPGPVKKKTSAKPIDCMGKTFGEKRGELLIVCQAIMKPYGIPMYEFSQSWLNGRAFCALIHSFRPFLIDKKYLTRMAPIETLNYAEKIAKSIDVDFDGKLAKLCDYKCKWFVKIYDYVARLHAKLLSLQKEEEEERSSEFI